MLSVMSAAQMENACSYYRLNWCENERLFQPILKKYSDNFELEYKAMKFQIIFKIAFKNDSSSQSSSRKIKALEINFPL